jgi:tetratricopeptide (TPR) repeat protein
MIESLGEKTKKIRKALKLTQTELAGSEMTKSMLSQIENNIALPSMKNLQYLAGRLGQPVSYFFEDGDNPDNTMKVRINGDLKKVANLLLDKKFEIALASLLNMLKEYNFDRNSNLYADFLSKLGECYIELNDIDQGKENIIEAVNIYTKKYLYIDAAKAYILLMGIPWKNFNYEKCIDIVEEATDIYNGSLNKDTAFEIELLYNRSILHGSLNHFEKAIRDAQEALDISKKTKVYYRSDELYKNIAVFNFFMEKYDDFYKYICKARQFAMFTDNYNVLSTIEGFVGVHENKIGNPSNAVEYLLKALELSSEVVAPILYAELAKSYYMIEEYQDALDTITKIQYPNYSQNQYDYILIWESKIYESLCLSQLGKPEQALAAVLEGIEKIKVVGVTKALAFAYKTLSEIYSKNRDYESAFSILKKATDVMEEAQQKKLYY